MFWGDYHHGDYINVLVGKTLTACENLNDQIAFRVDDGTEYHLYHIQDCCENVYIEDICGDLSDLVGSPILLAEEVSNEPEPEFTDYTPESYTWTFYKLRTNKGSVTIRFLGTSNGYYSEGVSFGKCKWENMR